MPSGFLRGVGVVFGLFVGLAVPAAAGEIGVENVWARASAGAARNGAAFMIIENRAATDDALVAAHARVSDTVELHTHIDDGGVMRMRKVDRIPVPAGGRVALRPGGLHVMFIGLKAPLAEGERFDLALDFETGGGFWCRSRCGGRGRGDAGRRKGLGAGRDFCHNRLVPTRSQRRAGRKDPCPTRLPWSMTTGTF